MPMITIVFLRRGHRSSHPHPNTTRRKELNIIIRLRHPSRRRVSPLRRDLCRKSRVITPQFQRSFSFFLGGLLCPTQRTETRTALFRSAPLACAVITRQVRQGAPILRRIAVGGHAVVPCLEEGLEAGQTLGYQRPVHDHLGVDVGFDDVSDGVVVCRWTQTDETYDDNGDESGQLSDGHWLVPRGMTYKRRAAKMVSSLTRR